ncbi:response regulator [Pseudoalteromonas xiamenensis]|uniref:response regulator n=1 Tax=Pseudoalteromonas xiamenensis TaxID=882626 RepID=UPI0035E6910E
MMTKAEIILVEDDPDDVYLFMSACEHLEPQPHVAVLGNGAELVQLVEQEDCRDKVILIDLNMPLMDGLETMAKLNAFPEKDTLCFIGFTTSSNQNDVKRAYELGAKSFISKPGTLVEMIDLLQTLSRYWFKFNRFYKEV